MRILWAANLVDDLQFTLKNDNYYFHDTARSFELIFMKFTCLIQVHTRMNPNFFLNNWSSRTTNMGENVPLNLVFQLSFSQYRVTVVYECSLEWYRTVEHVYFGGLLVEGVACVWGICSLILCQLVSQLIHVLFLAFRHVRALFHELFHEIANQSLYTSHNIVVFIHLWFYKKLDEKLAISTSLTVCKNTDHLARTTKCEIRKMIGETVYKMPSVYFSFLSYCQHFFAFSSIW